MRRLMTVLALTALLTVGAVLLTAFAPAAGQPPLALLLGLLGTSLLIAMGRQLQRPVTVRRRREFLD